MKSKGGNKMNIFKKRHFSLLLAMVMLFGSIFGSLPVEAATSNPTLAWMDAKYDEIFDDYNSRNETKDWWKILEIGKAGGEVKEADLNWLRGQIDGKSKINPNPMIKHLLALRAAGINPRHYDDPVLGERDLINELLMNNNLSQLKGFWVVTFVLPAVTADDYDLTPAEQGVVDNLVDDLVNQRKVNVYNGKLWDLFGVTDATGAALAALAPFYETHANVKTAVDEALVEFSNLVRNDGALGDTQAGYAKNSNSTAFSLLGVASYEDNGLNMADSDIYTKNGNTMIDGMKLFDIPGNGFKWQLGMGFNDMATEQCFRAMVHYKSMIEGTGGVYNLRNVPLKDDVPGHEGEILADFSKYNIPQNGLITLGAKDENGQTLSGITWTLVDSTAGSITGNVFTAGTTTGIFQIKGQLGNEYIVVEISVFNTDEIEKVADIKIYGKEDELMLSREITISDLDLSDTGITRAYDETKVIHFLVGAIKSEKQGNIYPDNFDYEDNGGYVTSIFGEYGSWSYEFESGNTPGGVSDTGVEDGDTIVFRYMGE